MTVDHATLEAGVVTVGHAAGAHEAPNVLEIRNGATATVSETVRIGKNGSDAACILSNATLTCQKVLVGDTGVYTGDRELPARNRLTVCGEQANLDVKWSGTWAFFGDGRDNRFELTDGAVWRYDAAALYTCIQGAGSNNVVAVSDGAALRSTKDLFVGYHAGEFGNRIEVGAGGELEVAGVHLSRRGSGLVVSNGTLTCTTGRVVIGNAEGWLKAGETCEGARYTLRGADAVCRQDAVTGTYALFGRLARSCEMNVLDGATWAYDKDGVYTGIDNAGTHSNALNVARGGTFRTKKLFHVGYIADSGNAVNVYDGGVLDVGSLRVASKGQSVTVSNGVVTCTGDVVVGYVQNLIESADDRFVVAGTNSSVTVAGAFSTSESAASPTLAFQVPEGGYVQTPLTAKTIRLTANAVLAIDATAFQAALGSTAHVTLAEATVSCTVDAAVLAAANERLAAHRMAVSVVDGKRLVLRVRLAKAPGLAILVR